MVGRWLSAYRRDGENAFNRWGRRAQQNGTGTKADTARTREVERESERLKQLLGKKELKTAILRDLLKKGDRL